MEYNLDTTIKDLLVHGIISVRTFNCLHYAEMETLGDVFDYIEKPMDLMNLRNFGHKCYSEIDAVLKMTIKEHMVKTVEIVEVEKDKFLALGEKIVGIITDAYSLVTEGETDVKAYLKAAFPQPRELHELVMGDLENMLVVVEDYSLNENLEIRHSFKKYIELVLEKMEYAQEVENAIYVVYKQKNQNLAMQMEYFSYEQIANNFLSPIARNYLEQTFHEQISSSLSARSKTFAAKYLPHFTNLIKYAEEPLASYRRICPGQSMMKTLTEIFHFNQKFKLEFERVLKLTDDEVQMEYMKIQYPYLMSRQRQFVSDFMKENHHAPLFFLILQYLRLSESKSDKIYCLVHGIFDEKRRTIDEVADIMNLSRERVRQILEKKYRHAKIEINLAPKGKKAQNIPSTNDDVFEGYKILFELPFIYEKSEEFFRLKDEERLPDNFEVFASLVSLVADFNKKTVNGHTILINNNYQDLNLTDCLETLHSIINAKYSIDTYVPLDSVLITVPKTFRSQIKDLIIYVATEIYKVQIINDEKLLLPQNHIDIAAELYDILSKKGEPMHIEDIFNEFKMRYPSHKYTIPPKIKPFLFKHKHIRAVGKTSCYALDSWEGVYFGSIRDLLVDLLNASDVPLHIDNLYDGVIRHFPNTTKASISATMENENLQRFVGFEGGYYGLTSKEYPKEYIVASTHRFRFEERLQMFKKFVEAYHRFPSYNGSDHEASLMRWYYNVTTDTLSITDKQKTMLNDLLKHYDDLGIPRSTTESEFLIKCEDVKDYIRKYHTLPTNREAPELYAWLRRSRDNYDSFTDKRRQYMTDLLNYVLSFGFSI